MEAIDQSVLRETCASMQRQKLPRWRELPDLDLYMDQVLLLVGRCLNDRPDFDGKGLTAPMVNNYVKLGVMPPPVRKKYTRTHLAYLVVICILKAVLPISDIQRLIAAELSGQTVEEFYDRFCEMAEESARTTAAAHSSDGEAPPERVLLGAALRAQAEQTLALRLAASLPE